MSSPIVLFIEWYESLPVSHRQDIAILVGTYCPGFDKVGIDTEIDTLPQLFAETLRDYQDGSLRELGAVLSLRSFIQCVFIDKRSDRSDWKDTQSMLSSLAFESETFKHLAKEIPFKAEQWIVTCEKWSKLVASGLSDQNIKRLLP